MPDWPQVRGEDASLMGWSSPPAPCRGREVCLLLIFPPFILFWKCRRSFTVDYAFEICVRQGYSIAFQRLHSNSNLKCFCLFLPLFYYSNLHCRLLVRRVQKFSLRGKLCRSSSVSNQSHISPRLQKSCKSCRNKLATAQMLAIVHYQYTW